MKLNQLSVFGVSTTVAVALLMSACGSPKDRERGAVKMTATPTTAQGDAGKLSTNSQAAATNDIINKPIEIKETEKQLVMSIQALELNIDQSKNQYILTGIATGTPASLGGPKEFTTTFDLTKVDASTGIIQTKDESHGLEFSLFVGNSTDKQKHVTIKSDLLKSKIVVPIYVISDLSVTTIASTELDSKKVATASEISAEKRAETFAKALGVTFVKKETTENAALPAEAKGKLTATPKEEVSATTQLTSEVIVLKLADRNFISLKVQKVNDKKQAVSVIEAFGIENGVNGSKEALAKTLRVQLKKSPISEDGKGIEANLIGNRTYENTDLKLDVSIVGLPGSSSNARYSVTLLIKKEQPVTTPVVSDDKQPEAAKEVTEKTDKAAGASSAPGQVSAASQDSKAAVTGNESEQPKAVVEEGNAKAVAPAGKPTTDPVPKVVVPKAKLKKASLDPVLIQMSNGIVSSTDLV